MAERPTGMRNRVAVVAAVLAFALAVAGVAVVAGRSDDGDSLPLLAYDTVAPSRAAAGMATADAKAELAYYPGVEYRMPTPLAQPAATAPAYRLRGATKADADRLAAAFGLGAAVEQDQAWVATGDAGQLWVDSSGRWFLGPDKVAVAEDTAVATKRAVAPSGAPVSGGGSSSTGSGSTGSGSTGSAGSATSSIAVGECAPCPPDAVCTMDCRPPERPAGLPTASEAEAVARELWRKAGVDVGDAKVQADDAFSSWSVHFTPAVDGHAADGLTFSVSVGPQKAVQYANGTVLGFEKLGNYPLISPAAALDRLNNPPVYSDLRESDPRPMPAESSAGAGSSTANAGSSEPGAPPTPDAKPPSDAKPPVDGAEPMPVPMPPVPTPEPRVEDVTSVRVVLQFNGSTSLLPFYVFTTASGVDTMPVPAVPDRFLSRGGAAE